MSFESQRCIKIDYSRSSLLCVAIGILGCSPSSPKVAESSDPGSQNDTAQVVAPDLDAIWSCPLEVRGLDVVVDSMMSAAYHERIAFRPSQRIFERWGTVDSIGEEPDEVLKALATDGHELRFRDPDKSRNAHIILELACFGSDTAARSCFDVLERHATASDTGVPGLTYTNDDVRLKGNRVAWINSTCRLSSPYHRKLAGLLLERLGFGNEDRRIECDCGEVICVVRE